ncbi:MAG: signal recognition particle-docking protein FtsY [candidate division Zixibacteria bacterium]|nr:signal recognition particle-docking protein FtsY [Candidatus Tariuqbacter arcticus]
MGLISAFRKGLARTRDSLNIGALLKNGRRLDEDFINELEEILYEGDLGVEVTELLIEALRERARRSDGKVELKDILQEEMVKLFPDDYSVQIHHKPEVILLVGVNGCGKTTTAGKLAHNYIQDGKKVVLAAGDTFRAAAVEQLEMWGKRAGARVVRQSQGADPASVAYDALQSAIARGEDTLIIDTAGRLHSKSNLMNELEKIVRVLKKLDPETPHQVLLVLDSIIGQNAIEQARVFTEKAGVTGLILTKLDGTARGGSAFAASSRFGIPIQYIGVGEKITDLLAFDRELFVGELLG